MDRACKYNTQGEYVCSSDNMSQVSKGFEPFSVASDAVMAFAANKCPESYKKKPFTFAEETKSGVISGYDPRLTLNKGVN